MPEAQGRGDCLGESMAGDHREESVEREEAVFCGLCDEKEPPEHRALAANRRKPGPGAMGAASSCSGP